MYMTKKLFVNLCFPISIFKDAFVYRHRNPLCDYKVMDLSGIKC
jgi:hypothetical protein